MRPFKKSKQTPKPESAEDEVHLHPLCDAAKHVRSGCNQTQQAFAERLGTTIMTVSRWETGKTIPQDSAILTRLAAAARSIGFSDEAREFDKANPQSHTYPGSGLNPPEGHPWMGYGFVQSRIMAIARTVAMYDKERLPQLEAAAGPWVEIVDNIFREAGEIWEIDYPVIDRRLCNLGDVQAWEQLYRKEQDQ
jgi:transcriptional regulator with XRE-family HTH domain